MSHQLTECRFGVGFPLIDFDIDYFERCQTFLVTRADPEEFAFLQIQQQIVFTRTFGLYFQLPDRAGDIALAGCGNRSTDAFIV